MKNLKSKGLTPYQPQPVWCFHCCIRIAPYDLRTIFHGKAYHRDCYTKAANAPNKNKN